ncbi:MAG TPA: PhoH family protein [bacterium]|uniref:PhoH-like protein n=1 Tax=candidate division TA06 bacterium ADurb.Bin417 TaxID=1852828 RepID=A0A1V5ML81_UNCT6|nr:MAG: PhoH-like protein [candidate division TA06 bacterium ADurb.Bin417]HNQ34720.1 PhoH family protein [bacterium]HNS48654.1 PhoH family protein [bacterium]
MKRITIIDQEIARQFFGQFDRNIRQLEKDFSVTIAGRGNELIIKGARRKVLAAQQAVENRLASLEGRPAAAPVSPKPSQADRETEPAGETIQVGSKRTRIVPRTEGQLRYVEAIRRSEIVVGIGPAGTGKTFLAVSLAIENLRENKVERIVITRPAIEAGEKLGFLPGDLEEKIRPYLQPIYDALYDLLWPEEIRRLMEHRIIEILPLAYMRGRTLGDAFILLDEAQNATPEQMKMFLTRIGVGSKAVVTGDITQSDLPMEQTSGLEDIEKFLKTIPGIEFAYLDEKDVVRHPLVREIIRAYEIEKNRRRTSLAKPAAQRKSKPKTAGQQDA